MRYTIVNTVGNEAAYFVRGLERFFNLRLVAALGLLGLALSAQEPPQKKRAPRPPLPGVKEVQKPMDLLKPDVTFSVPGVPD